MHGWLNFSIPLVMFCNKSSTPLNEVVVCQSKEIHQGCSAYTSVRGGGNKVLHLCIIIDDSNIEFFFNR